MLDRGSISQAMRASMSVPGAMSPVEINGRLLVDGGIANNLPIDEARKLCADVIIAVDISTPPLRRDQITSAFSVSAQLINFLGKVTVEQQVKSLTDKDVLISPKLGDISAGSFDRAKDSIRIGEEAARAAADRLRRYSLPPEQYAALRATQTREHARTSPPWTRSASRACSAPIPRCCARSSGRSPASRSRRETIGADLRRIYGRGDFESVDYRIMQEPGKRVMIIQPREKDWGPDYLRFGLGFATDFRGEAPFTALVQYRKTWLNRLGGEWLTEAQIGRENRLFTEFYQPVDERGRWFVAPYASVSRSTRGVFFDETRVAEYDVKEARVGVDAGAVLGTWGELRLGPLWRRIDAEVDTGSPVLPSLTQTSAGVRARLFADQLDNPFFPRGGYRIAGSAYVADEGLGSDRNYKRFEAELQAAASWRRAQLQPECGRRNGCPFRHACLRNIHPGRAAAPLGLSHQRVLRPAHDLRPRDVLQPRAASPVDSWIRRLRGRLARGRRDERPVRRVLVQGNDCLGLGLPRRGDVRRPGILRTGRRRERPL